MWGAGRNSSPWKSPFSKWMTRLPVSRSRASALRIDAHCLGRTKCEVRLERTHSGGAVTVAMAGTSSLPGLPRRWTLPSPDDDPLGPRERRGRGGLGLPRNPDRGWGTTPDPLSHPLAHHCERALVLVEE